MKPLQELRSSLDCRFGDRNYQTRSGYRRTQYDIETSQHWRVPYF
jgi:hypothetical protein